MSTENVKEIVKEKYGNAALRVTSGDGNSCCGHDRSGLDRSGDPLTSNLYDAAQEGEVPDTAIKASLGCGNPTALAELEFLKGEIEHIPLPDNSVDVIISNCVINLSGDKDRVLKEAFRVLKPGGRFAVSDVVVRGHVPDAIKKNMELWVGCVAGALSDDEYVSKLAGTGFEYVGIEPTRVYSIEDARGLLSGKGLDVDALAGEVEGKFISAFVRASKPPTGCCAPVAAPKNGGDRRTKLMELDHEETSINSLHRKFRPEPDG